jgi:transcriptional regulator with XRE-family HTH domain
MTFGQRLSYIRKEKKMRQTDLGKAVGTSGDIIGKYERDENMPSVEIATKMAKELGVSLDYLVGKTDMELDDTIVNRVLAISNLPKDRKDFILQTVDALLRDAKTQIAYK